MVKMLYVSTFIVFIGLILECVILQNLTKISFEICKLKRMFANVEASFEEVLSYI